MRNYTEQETPTLRLVNQIRVELHLFVDFKEVTVVAAHKEKTIELKPGAHTITCSESVDGDDAPVSIAETFEVGYFYEYVVVAR